MCVRTLVDNMITVVCAGVPYGVKMDMSTRLNIAIDVATALTYLHYYTGRSPHNVHPSEPLDEGHWSLRILHYPMTMKLVVVTLKFVMNPILVSNSYSCQWHVLSVVQFIVAHAFL